MSTAHLLQLTSDLELRSASFYNAFHPDFLPNHFPVIVRDWKQVVLETATVVLSHFQLIVLVVNQWIVHQRIVIVSSSDHTLRTVWNRNASVAL